MLLSAIDSRRSMTCTKMGAALTAPGPGPLLLPHTLSHQEASCLLASESLGRLLPALPSRELRQARQDDHLRPPRPAVMPARPWSCRLCVCGVEWIGRERASKQASRQAEPPSKQARQGEILRSVWVSEMEPRAPSRCIYYAALPRTTPCPVILPLAASLAVASSSTSPHRHYTADLAGRPSSPSLPPLLLSRPCAPALRHCHPVAAAIAAAQHTPALHCNPSAAFCARLPRPTIPLLSIPDRLPATCDVRAKQPDSPPLLAAWHVR
jgi:hypothetical protein